MEGSRVDGLDSFRTRTPTRQCLSHQTATSGHTYADLHLRCSAGRSFTRKVDVMKSIALVLPYFGSLDRTGFFRHFLTSCAFNPSIDFLIFTDDESEWDYPDNVEVRRLPFESLRDRVAAHFNFPISLEQPYKLCDFKVAYGEIFEEELRGYDYWGYVDADVILGNVRSFLTDGVLNGYLKIYSRGHLTLMENRPEVSGLYRLEDNPRIPSYRDVFSSGKSYQFDEWGGIDLMFISRNLPMYDQLDFDDTDVRYAPFRPIQRVKNSPHSAMRDICYTFENGRLVRHAEFYGEVAREDICYLHLPKRRMVDNLPERATRFTVIPDSFEPYRSVDQNFLNSIARTGIRREYSHPARLRRRAKRIVESLRPNA